MSTLPLRQTPLYSEHERLGARLVPYAGWKMPLQYAGIVAEHHAVRKQAGLFDVSHMGRLEITGPGALGAVNRLITNDLLSIPNGHAAYACCCRADGGILDDVIAYRHSPERILVVCNASNLEKIRNHFVLQLRDSARLVDLSATTGMLALQGPCAFEIIQKASGNQFSNLTRFSIASGKIAGTEVLVARTGYTGEDGFEVLIPANEIVACWQVLLDAGSTYGLAPIGLGARDTLRLEACLSLYGHEIDETIHPFEAGLAFAVRLDKSEFIGQSALRQYLSDGLKRKLAGIMMSERGVARENYPIMNESGQQIGSVTSGCPSPTLGRNIALAYLPPQMATVGTTVAVDCRGKSVAAQVVSTPFYKRSKNR